MTADSYLVVRCDGRTPDGQDCDTEGHWPVRVETHRQVRRLLRVHRGWRWTRSGRDLCPDCAKAGYS